MSNNLTNNMISILTSVNNDLNEKIENDKSIYQVDIKTIVTNAKNDKRFHKLLSLCIKYDIHLFNQCNDICKLLSIENLLLQANQKQKNLTKELSDKINEISMNGPTNSWLLDIDNTFSYYKKLFKEIEIIDYVLKNIYNDQQLEDLCCIKNIQQISSNSPDYNITSSTTKITNSYQNDQTSQTDHTFQTEQKIKNTEKNKKEKLSKYIAIYCN
jgi:hypothetical protein